MMMWSFFPWPVLFVIPAMIVMGVFMARRMGFGRSGMGRGCGVGPAPIAPEPLAKPPAKEDPMVTLRERYARGEIDVTEFEQRVEGLLRTEPTGALPPWSK